MPIESTDFIWRKAANTSDATAANNGGRMSSTAIADNVRNALFPDVTQAQRDNGATHWRKAFIHVASSTTIELLDAKVYVAEPTPGDDFVTIHPGTQSDTQATMIGREYGAGPLYTDASIGADAITVIPDGYGDLGSLAPFQAGDLIRVSDGTNTEFHIIGTVTDNSTHLSLALNGSVLEFGYTQANDTVISSVIEQASVVASAGNFTLTTTSGTPDQAAVMGSNKGAVQDTITLTFTSASGFTAAGVILGALGTGTTGATFQPSNAGVGAPYFSIPSTAWGGTWASGETVEFDLEPASIPIWYRREVPADSGSLAGNSVVVGITGESAE